MTDRATGITKFGSGETVVFRGSRQLIINVLLISSWFLLLLAILLSVSMGQSSDAGSAVAFCVPLLVILAALGIRQQWAATLTLNENELVYRTSVRTLHIPRIQVTDVVIEKRLRGAIRLWIPYLVLANGSKLRLADLSTGVRSSMDEPDSYNEQTKFMLTSVQSWLKTKPRV